LFRQRRIFKKVNLLAQFFLFRGRNFQKKNQYFGTILLVSWEKFSKKINILVKFFFFRGRNFQKIQFFDQILFVLTDNFCQKVNFWIKFFFFRGRNFFSKSQCLVKFFLFCHRKLSQEVIFLISSGREKRSGANRCLFLIPKIKQ